MEEKVKDNIKMEEDIKGGNNRNLITALITLIILVIVAVIYWDRQSQRAFQQARAEMQGGLLEEFGPQAQQQIQAALQGQPVAFSRQISYKNIVARIAPSVVSVSVGTSFINQGDLAQNVWWGGKMGGWGTGQGGHWVCPGCRTNVPCRRGIATSGLNCPSCGMRMMHGCSPGVCPLAVQSQPPTTQNQPADQSPGATGFGQYVWGGRMGGWGMGPGGLLVCPNCGKQVSHQRGVPSYTTSCPDCGTQMMRQGAPAPCPVPGQAQQMANTPIQRGQGLYPWCPPGGQLAAQNQPALAQGKVNKFQALGRGGSGVIVSSSGYILTNHHVIHGARNITVTLSIGQITKTYPAKLIDEAPDLDFAILKILANGNERFTAAPIGNSSEMSVGDEVLALGSPFGLQQSVTFGIVSNKNRTLTVGNKKFTNFIQTDAPINPGSSGGPLINVNGEVIAITTAIYSPTQAFSGIGFASPIDPAKASFPEFIDTTSNAVGILRRNIPNWARGPALQQAAQFQQGQGLYPWCPPGGRMQQMANTPIQRGQGLFPWCPPGGRMRQAANTQSQPWLGIRVLAVDKEIVSFIGLPMTYGVLVMEVYDGSPCRAVGLQKGDVIIRVDNRSVKDSTMLEAALAGKRVGDKMKLTIYREGKKMNLRPILTPRTIGPQGAAVGFWQEGPEWTEPLQAQPVALAQQPFNPGIVGPPPGLTGVLQGGEVGAGEIEALGMELTELSPATALVYGVPEGVRGLVVAESATQAAAAGLMKDDIIEVINGQPVETIVDFINVMNNASLRDGISLGVYRQGQRVSLTMRG